MPIDVHMDGSAIRKLDATTIVMCFVVIPAVLGLLGTPLLVWLFAEGRTFEAGSTGSAIHGWWRDGFGLPVVSAMLAALVAAIRVRRAGAVVGAATGAAVLSWLFPIAAFLVFVLLGGDPGWR